MTHTRCSTTTYSVCMYAIRPNIVPQDIVCLWEHTRYRGVKCGVPCVCVYTL